MRNTQDGVAGQKEKLSSPLHIERLRFMLVVCALAVAALAYGGAISGFVALLFVGALCAGYRASHDFWVAEFCTNKKELVVSSGCPPEQLVVIAQNYRARAYLAAAAFVLSLTLAFSLAH